MYFWHALDMPLILSLGSNYDSTPILVGSKLLAM